jgi:hypothetical protein
MRVLLCLLVSAIIGVPQNIPTTTANSVPIASATTSSSKVVAQSRGSSGNGPRFTVHFDTQAPKTAQSVTPDIGNTPTLAVYTISPGKTVTR